MRCLKATMLVAMVVGVAALQGQGPAGFKLGTFEAGGRTFIGVVVNDAVVVDLEQANAAFEKQSAGAPRLAIPRDMKELIAKYDGGLAQRIAALAGQASAQPRPAYVSDVKSRAFPEPKHGFPGASDAAVPLYGSGGTGATGAASDGDAAKNRNKEAKPHADHHVHP